MRVDSNRLLGLLTAEYVLLIEFHHLVYTKAAVFQGTAWLKAVDDTAIVTWANAGDVPNKNAFITKSQ